MRAGVASALICRVWSLHVTCGLCLLISCLPVFFTWLALVSFTCVTWQLSVMNLGVHVLLYTYYALAAMGIDIWFKRSVSEAAIMANDTIDTHVTSTTFHS